MPTVTLNKKALETYIGKKVSDDVLSNAITYFGCSVESSNTQTIQVEVGPNRPDLLSEPGLGRAISGFLGVKTGLQKYSVKKSSYEVIVEPSVKDVRGFTACAVVTGLNFDDEKIKEIIQIQEKLHVTYGRNRKKVAIGVYPLNKITFPVYFKADDSKKIKFIPLEEDREMTGAEILRSTSTGREFAHLLEGQKVFPYFVDAAGSILSMPPIINSDSVGKIEYETKDVFVECSGFNQTVLDICLNMVVSALADMGGVIHSVMIHNKHAKWKKESPCFDPTEMDIDSAYVNKRLGTSFTQKDLKQLLEKMGYGVGKKVLVPAYRADVLHQIDLVEDIAIAYGYEKFKPSLPSAASVGSLSKSSSYKQKIAALLTGLGLFETNTYCLIGINRDSVKLINSVSEGFDYLRSSVLDSLLLVIQQNRNREYPQGFFEVGRVFSYGEAEIFEREKLGFVFAGGSADYTYARQVLEYVLDATGVTYSFKKSENSFFMKGRAADIIVAGKVVGSVGLVNPKVLDSLSIEMPTCGFELDFNVFFGD
jgi:phenylalanyl-tRNA synthetase beta chain